jgi:hypothetical protein
MQFTQFALESGKSFLVKGYKEEALMGFVAFITHKWDTQNVTSIAVT